MMNEPLRTGERACEQCGTHFECGIAAGNARCWCFELPPVMMVSPDTTCLCPDCLREAIETKREEG